MALTIIRANEPVVVKNLKIVLYGEPNIGKTTLAMSYPKPFILDFDGGSQRGVRSGSDVIARVANWDDVNEAIQQTQTFKDYDTVIIDTVSKCLDFMAVDIIRKDSKMGFGGALSQKGWGVLGNRFNLWLQQLVETGKDVVMLAQARETDKDDTTKVRIKAQGQSQGIITEAADMMGYIFSRNNERTISFTYCDQWFAKDVKDTMGTFVLANPNVVKDQGVQMLTKMKTAFTLHAQAEQELAQKVNDWKDTIEGFTTPDEFNAIWKEFSEMSGPLRAQVATVIKARRTALSIEHSPERGFFKVTTTTVPMAAAPVAAPPPPAEPKPTPIAEALAPVAAPAPAHPNAVDF